MSSSSKRNSTSVITRLQGGLGNQIILYAAARGLAHVNKAALKLKTHSDFEEDTRHRRTRMLQDFNIPFSEATPQEAFVGEVRRKKPKQDQDPEFSHLDWPRIISVHFRRVDYGYLLPVEYYRAAVEAAGKGSTGFTYLALGDDLDFILDHASSIFPDNARVPSPHHVADQLVDFDRLTRYGKLSIANSTFSWWATWLNDQPNKAVWAPKSWGCNAKVSRHWNAI